MHKSLDQLIIYEIYVRNHSPQGTFNAILPDLDRILSLGVDVIWLMPIHHIGQVNHKGSLGCPYSISDYLSINPDYGTLADFNNLISEIHSRGMKVIIDVVFNHTSHDSILVQNHPEFFHQGIDGLPVTTVPEWSDVIDLNHPQPELTEYLANCLIYWLDQGVDGFRCDVASLVPIEVWKELRQKIDQHSGETLWLAESVHASFIEHRRQNGYLTWSDGELYQAFDITYDYDIFPIFQAAVTGKVPVSDYLMMVRFQHSIYPQNSVKMHFVENHDQRRIISLTETREQAEAWTAFEAFNRGAFLIYAGQESAAIYTPSLFDKDTIEWGNYEYQQFLTTLSNLKKQPVYAEGRFIIHQAEPVIIAAYVSSKMSLVGLFNVNRTSGQLSIDLPDGAYTDLITLQPIYCKGGKISSPRNVYILEVDFAVDFSPFFSPLMDTDIKPVYSISP